MEIEKKSHTNIHKIKMILFEFYMTISPLVLFINKSSSLSLSLRPRLFLALKVLFVKCNSFCWMKTMCAFLFKPIDPFIYFICSFLMHNMMNILFGCNKVDLHKYLNNLKDAIHCIVTDRCVKTFKTKV